MAFLNPAAVSYGGTSSTAVTALGAMLNSDPSLIDQSTLVPIGIFISGILGTAFLVWRVADQKSKYEMDMFQLKRRLEALESKEEARAAED